MVNSWASWQQEWSKHQYSSDLNRICILLFLTIVAHSPISIRVSFRDNGFGLINGEINSKFLEPRADFIRCYISIAISINFIENL